MYPNFLEAMDFGQSVELAVTEFAQTVLTEQMRRGGWAPIETDWPSAHLLTSKANILRDFSSRMDVEIACLPQRRGGPSVRGAPVGNANNPREAAAVMEAIREAAAKDELKMMLSQLRAENAELEKKLASARKQVELFPTKE